MAKLRDKTLVRGSISVEKEIIEVFDPTNPDDVLKAASLGLIEELLGVSRVDALIVLKNSNKVLDDYAKYFTTSELINAGIEV